MFGLSVPEDPTVRAAALVAFGALVVLLAIHHSFPVPR